MSVHLEQLAPDRRRIVDALRRSASVHLDHTPRFRYFTLHGSAHTGNLLDLLDILYDAGLRLDQDESFYLLCAICCHDVGMVTPLAEFDCSDVFLGSGQPADPVHLEKLIRDTHHALVSQYVDSHFDFLAESGLTGPQCTLVSKIAAGHRVVDLSEEPGLRKTLVSRIVIALT